MAGKRGHNTTARLRAQEGTSLAEMLAGIAVMAAVMAAASPLFPSLLQGYSLLGASREMYAELQKARTSAVMANHRYQFTVVDAHQYKIHKDRNNNGIEDAGELVSIRDIAKDSPRTSLTAGTTIVFAANGSAPTPGTVVVTGRSGDVKRVVVSPAGRVRIQ